MEKLKDFVLLQPLPHACSSMGEIIESAVRANPERGLSNFVPTLDKCIQEEVEREWLSPHLHESLISP